MIAYKGFESNLTCRGYQFTENKIHETEAANCVKNGFHCAENPLDCLTYYSDFRHSVYYLVEAYGDLNEDGGDSKIAATKLRLIRKLSIMQLIYEGVLYMINYPMRKIHKTVRNEVGSGDGYIIVRGKKPKASGKIGTIVAILKEDANSAEITDISFFQIDGKKYKADVWYNAYGYEVENEEKGTDEIKAA